MRIQPVLAMTVLCACGPKPAAKHEPAGPKPDVVPEARVALVEVPRGALGEAHVVSYLTMAPDGALAIGKVDTRGELDVSSLEVAAIDPTALSCWYDPGAPPVPPKPGEDFGAFGAALSGCGGLGTAFGDDDLYGGLTADYTVRETPCGTALHLDPTEDLPAALLIADAAANANAVLDVLAEMPRPVALLARGDDPRGFPLRLIVDGQADIVDGDRVHVSRGGATADEARDAIDVTARSGTDARAQTSIVIDADATAQDLLAVLAGLALADVREVVLDRGQICKVVDMSGGFGYGRSGFGPGGGGTGEGTGDGYGTIGHGDGTSETEIPKLTLAKKLDVKGKLDDAIVRRYLERHASRMLYCYEKFLLANDALAGDATATFTIDAEGKVSSASVSGFDEDVDACLEDAVRAIEFPEPESGTVSVKAKLTFERSGG